jgi:DNA (cytosine-5)-methyltransferase 1
MNKVDITTNELFSGIGAQKRGIDLTGLFNCKVISTSDIDKDVMVSYAAIHHGLTKELINTYSNYPSKEEMAQLLSDRNIGYDFKNNKSYDWNKHIKQKNKTLEKYYLACVLADNLGDISRIETLPYADLWTYSFPCTDISVAGKQEGIVKGKTRSGLLYEVDRLLEVADKYNTKPKFLLLENVKNLVGKQFKEQFDDWINRLSELGYNTYWKVVNGKECGIPQNRERTFAISIRKDIDTGLFEFNKPFDNGLRLKDLLDETVDEKYYISEDKLDRFITELNTSTALLYDNCQVKREGKSREYNDYCPTLNSRDYKDPRLVNETVLTPIDKSFNNPKPIDVANCLTAREDRGISNRKKEGTAVLESKLIQLGNYRESSGSFDNPQTGRVDSASGIAPTLNTMQGGDRQPKILEDFYGNREIRQYEDYSPTLRSERSGLKVADRRVRKLTPTECFRLMGFTDRDISLCMDMDISDSQLYKEAGNSIITFCIKLIMEHLYKALYNNTYICTDEKVLNGEIEEINFTQPQAV